MQQHREVEHHRERATPTTYFHAPRPGCDLVDPRAPSRTRSAPATRNQDDEISTSLPAMRARSGTCREAAADASGPAAWLRVGRTHVRGYPSRSTRARRRRRVCRCRRLGVGHRERVTTWRRRRPRGDPRPSGSAPPSTASTCSGALSPSRAGDFMSCPLLYRFRTIDRLPEPFSPDAVRGTVVHKVLEDLFDLPADRAHARAGPRHAGARLGGAARGRARARRDVRHGEGARGRRLAGLLPRRARPLLHAGGPAAARASRARALRRDASPTPSCCCAASSTGSTSRPTGRSGWSTTRPAARPASGSRPRRCSR